MNTISEYRKERMKAKYIEVLIFNSKEDIQKYYAEGEDTVVSRQIIPENEYDRQSIIKTMTKGQMMLAQPMK